MKKAQAVTMDLVGAFAILVMLFTGVLIFIAYTTPDSSERNFPDVLSRLDRRLAEENTFVGKRIDFLNDYDLNATRLDAFKNLSRDNHDLFTSYFFEPQNAFPCVFLTNKSFDYVNFSDGQFAFGNVSNGTFASLPSENFKSCQFNINNGNSPCSFYKHSYAITRPVLFNQSYYTFNIVICYD